MGRFPITHKAWGQSIKYCVRLESGTGNKLLNEAFYQTKRDSHEWIQSIENMLRTNGFRDVWMNPRCYDLRSFHKAFTERLNDQYRQSITSTLRSSSSFRTLSALKDDVHISKYLTCIQNPDIRLIFTRLRIDMNCLATCKTKRNSTQGGTVWPMCNQGSETVEHFLLNCKHFHDIRLRFLTSLKAYTKCFVYFNSDQKLRYILDLNCPPDAIKICCSFVSESYRKRECIQLRNHFLSPFNKYTKSVKYGYIIFDAEMPPYGSAK